ncbi:MAG TPA: ATP-binding protein, partial [Acidimicrobiales bacterium]
VDGLAAMRPGPRHPLLALRRAETVDLCRRLGLAPVHDPSNDDPRFVRNRIRHELVPLCSAIAGRDIVPVLARQARVLAGDADLLGALASLVDPRDAASLAGAPQAVARRSVRGWLAGQAAHPPPLDAVERVLEVARKERRATEVPGGLRVSRSDGRLSVGPAIPPPGSGATGTPVQSGRGHPGERGTSRSEAPRGR